MKQHRILYTWDEATKSLIEIANTAAAPVHAVIQDTIDARECPADGKVYESRSAFNRAVKAAGAVDLTPKDIENMRGKTRSIWNEARDDALSNAIKRAENDLYWNAVPRHETPQHVKDLWNKIERGE